MAEARSIQIVNRKARYEFAFLDSYEAGLHLLGTEVKSLRAGNASMSDAYCIFLGNELFLKNLYIAEYNKSNYYNHEPRRDRKLLLKKRELKKLQRRVREKGHTIVPYKIYFSARGIAKIEIKLAQGKKSFDKRETIKLRDSTRELKRISKYDL